MLGPQPHLDSGQPESDRLQGTLAKPQAAGKLHFTHITLCLGQEDEALRGQGSCVGVGAELTAGHLGPHGASTPQLGPAGPRPIPGQWCAGARLTTGSPKEKHRFVVFACGVKTVTTAAFPDLLRADVGSDVQSMLS